MPTKSRGQATGQGKGAEPNVKPDGKVTIKFDPTSIALVAKE
jgi:hypothetical protein